MIKLLTTDYKAIHYYYNNNSNTDFFPFPRIPIVCMPWSIDCSCSAAVTLLD